MTRGHTPFPYLSNVARFEWLRAQARAWFDKHTIHTVRGLILHPLYLWEGASARCRVLPSPNQGNKNSDFVLIEGVLLPLSLRKGMLDSQELSGVRINSLLCLYGLREGKRRAEKIRG